LRTAQPAGQQKGWRRTRGVRLLCCVGVCNPRGGGRAGIPEARAAEERAHAAASRAAAAAEAAAEKELATPPPLNFSSPNPNPF
jgi:hypothetical protein